MSCPTFVAQFANGETTRLTVYTSLALLDFERGIRLSHAAMELRTSRRPELLEGSGTIVAGWFELDGRKLADMPAEADEPSLKPSKPAGPPKLARRKPVGLEG